MSETEQLAETILSLLSASISHPVSRAILTLIDKVLNRALDYDARILTPEYFSILATRLDRAVRNTLSKVLNVANFNGIDERNLRLAVGRGGCGIMAACQTSKFVDLAAPCQYMPVVANNLKDLLCIFLNPVVFVIRAQSLHFSP